MKICPHGTVVRRRSGVMTMELVLVLPLLLLVLFGVGEFSMLISARQSMVAASRDGARVASMAGATSGDVERVVRERLGDSFGDDLVIDLDLGRRSGDSVVVTLRLPMRCASPDLLRIVGIGLEEHELIAETAMCKE